MFLQLRLQSPFGLSDVDLAAAAGDTIYRIEGSATARLGVRDFEIHWISRGFRISDWISVFHMDFWISKWVSGFQSGFLNFKVDFRISKWISGFQSGISGFQSRFLDLKVDFYISKWILHGFCLKNYCYSEDTAHEQ